MPRLITSPTFARKSLRLPKSIAQWWEKETLRIAREEHLHNFSLTALLCRIAVAQLNFTNDSIARYNQPPPEENSIG